MTSRELIKKFFGVECPVDLDVWDFLDELEKNLFKKWFGVEAPKDWSIRISEHKYRVQTWSPYAANKADTLRMANSDHFISVDGDYGGAAIFTIECPKQYREEFDNFKKQRETILAKLNQEEAK
jgi:hypothetical protein